MQSMQSMQSTQSTQSMQTMQRRRAMVLGALSAAGLTTFAARVVKFSGARPASI